MKISPETQKIIEYEVSKRTAQLESEYKDHFSKLKSELYSTLKEYASESIKKNIQFESLDSKCDVLKYKPMVEGIVALLNGNGIKVLLNESSQYESEANQVLLEAVKEIQELRDMLAIHEMIESGLSGMSRNIVDTTIKRFKNDPRFANMKKEDFLKEVSNYVLNMKDGVPNRSVQFESKDIDIDVELSEADKLLESTNTKTTSDKDPYTDKFNPKMKINIPSLKKRVLDEAYSISAPKTNAIDFSEDPVKEFMENWG